MEERPDPRTKTEPRDLWTWDVRQVKTAHHGHVEVEFVGFPEEAEGVQVQADCWESAHLQGAHHWHEPQVTCSS